MSRREQLAPLATSVSSNPLGWTSNSLLDALSKSPADTVQAFLSIVLLFSLRTLLPRLLRVIVVTSASVVTSSSSSGTAASVDEHAWQSSQWKWALRNVYPVLSIALVVDIVGRVAAILAATTTHPWALVVVDNIAR